MSRIATLLAVISSAVCFAAPAAAQNIAGLYQVSGKNFDGAPYSGSAEITATGNNTCQIVWRIGKPGGLSRGICMRNGNSFSASYVLDGKAGLVIYELKSDGSLDGLWTIADQNGYGTEHLAPIR